MHKFFSDSFSQIGYYRILNRVPCAIYSRSMLVIYFIYSSVNFSIYFYTAGIDRSLKWLRIELCYMI